MKPENPIDELLKKNTSDLSDGLLKKDASLNRYVGGIKVSDVRTSRRFADLCANPRAVEGGWDAVRMVGAALAWVSAKDASQLPGSRQLWAELATIPGMGQAIADQIISFLPPPNFLKAHALKLYLDDRKDGKLPYGVDPEADFRAGINWFRSDYWHAGDPDYRLTFAGACCIEGDANLKTPTLLPVLYPKGIKESPRALKHIHGQDVDILEYAFMHITRTEKDSSQKEYLLRKLVDLFDQSSSPVRASAARMVDNVMRDINTGEFPLRVNQRRDSWVGGEFLSTLRCVQFADFDPKIHKHAFHGRYDTVNWEALPRKLNLLHALVWSGLSEEIVSDGIRNLARFQTELDVLTKPGRGANRSKWRPDTVFTVAMGSIGISRLKTLFDAGYDIHRHGDLAFERMTEMGAAGQLADPNAPGFIRAHLALGAVHEAAADTKHLRPLDP